MNFKEARNPVWSFHIWKSHGTLQDLGARPRDRALMYLCPGQIPGQWMAGPRIFFSFFPLHQHGCCGNEEPKTPETRCLCIGLPPRT